MERAALEEVFGATIRQIIDPGTSTCAWRGCKSQPVWTVYQEGYEAQDDPRWNACHSHLENVSVDAIDYREEDDDQ